MSNYVPGIGPSRARLMVVGDVPTNADAISGKPFSGRVGEEVKKFIGYGGMNPNDVYYTNVVKHHVKEIDQLKYLGKSLDDYRPQITEEIEKLQPNCILALGNIPLQLFSGYTGVDKYRGSILRNKLVDGKFVSSINPASLFMKDVDGKMRSWSDHIPIQWDFIRAVNQSKFPEYNPPRRKLDIVHTSSRLENFFNLYEHEEYCACDIETFMTIPSCISFAFTPDHAISVPLFNLGDDPKYHNDLSDRVRVWKLIADFLADPKIKKVWQNGKFDETLLRKCFDDTINFGFQVNGFYHDTMLAARVLYPELSPSLQFLTSIYTEEPYYKEEGKGYNPKKDKVDRLLLYNAKDAALTIEVFIAQQKELKERSLEEFCYKYFMPLHCFYRRVEARGFLIDKVLQKQIIKKYEDEVDIIHKEFLSYANQYMSGDINVNSNGKSGQVPFLLFVAMKLPGRAGTDEDSLDKLMRNAVKDPTKKKVLQLLLKERKARKALNTYANVQTDHNGRVRTQYRISVETGRTSTSIRQSPICTYKNGLALQTLTKHGEFGADTRRFYIPDPGHVFLEADGSNAEGRVVAHLSRDLAMLKSLRFGIDTHRYTYCLITNQVPKVFEDFMKSNDDEYCYKVAKEINAFMAGFVDKEKRQEGKTARHAGNYNMGDGMAAQLMKCSQFKAGQTMKKFHAEAENIRKVFHAEINAILESEDKLLRAPYGGERQFMGRYGPDQQKEAYAYIPQRTVSDHVKYAARCIERRLPWTQFLLECHDGITQLIPLDIGSMYPFKYLDEAARVTKEEMERPIDFTNCSLSRGNLVIPCELTVGLYNWEDMLDYSIGMWEDQFDFEEIKNRVKQGFDDKRKKAEEKKKVSL